LAPHGKETQYPWNRRLGANSQYKPFDEENLYDMLNAILTEFPVVKHFTFYTLFLK
jgi:hypothetical protein